MSSEEVNANDSSSVRRLRGATLMRNIIQLRAHEETLQVQFTENGEAIGRNGSWFRSYLGYLPHSRVPINNDKWEDVPKDVKTLIWDEVKDEYAEQSSKGEFVSSESKDILTSALGTNERGGRVRGIGGNVGLRKVSGKVIKERRYSADEIDVMVKERVKREVMSFMTQMGFPLVEDEEEISDKAVISPTDEFFDSDITNKPFEQDPFAKMPECWRIVGIDEKWQLQEFYLDVKVIDFMAMYYQMIK